MHMCDPEAGWGSPKVPDVHNGLVIAHQGKHESKVCMLLCSADRNRGVYFPVSRVPLSVVRQRTKAGG